MINSQREERLQSAISPRGNYIVITTDAQRTYAVYRIAAETQALETREGSSKKISNSSIVAENSSKASGK